MRRLIKLLEKATDDRADLEERTKKIDALVDDSLATGKDHSIDVLVAIAMLIRDIGSRGPKQRRWVNAYIRDLQSDPDIVDAVPGLNKVLSGSKDGDDDDTVDDTVDEDDVIDNIKDTLASYHQDEPEPELESEPESAWESEPQQWQRPSSPELDRIRANLAPPQWSPPPQQSAWEPEPYEPAPQYQYQPPVDDTWTEQSFHQAMNSFQNAMYSYQNAGYGSAWNQRAAHKNYIANYNALIDALSAFQNPNKRRQAAELAIGMLRGFGKVKADSTGYIRSFHPIIDGYLVD
jgi:hypothetical protein